MGSPGRLETAEDALRLLAIGSDDDDVGALTGREIWSPVAEHTEIRSDQRQHAAFATAAPDHARGVEIAVRTRAVRPVRVLKMASSASSSGRPNSLADEVIE
jgi:hypothetical protein